MKKGKYKTRVITDESQVPDDFVRLKEYAETHDEYTRRKISEAHIDGLVRAVKLMRSPDDSTGPVWIHRGDAESIIGSPKPPRQTQQVLPLSCDTEIICALHDILRVLQQIENRLR